MKIFSQQHTYIIITLDMNILEDRQQRHLKKEMAKVDQFGAGKMLDLLKGS